MDFDKDFYSLCREFLASVMEQMTFGWKQRRQIKGCLDSCKAFVLVNVAPNKEFKIKRGVRQGDALVHFLFIIVMEGIHISMEEACDQHYFLGRALPYNGMNILHLMYTNDMTFIGEWSEIIFMNLNRFLHFF